METKEIKIQVPEGYEIDKENSTFECIKFKPKKLTYNDVAKLLFKGNPAYYINPWGDIQLVDLSTADSQCADPTHCIIKNQARKLLALNKLINVAKYLNGDWKPSFNYDSQLKYFINTNNNKVTIESWIALNWGTPCFKTKELAKQAIEILGEETIKLALSQV